MPFWTEIMRMDGTNTESPLSDDDREVWVHVTDPALTWALIHQLGGRCEDCWVRSQLCTTPLARRDARKRDRSHLVMAYRCRPRSSVVGRR